MPKSSYFYHRAVLSIPHKYAELRERVRIAFNEANGRYGYRRIPPFAGPSAELLLCVLAGAALSRKAFGPGQEFV
jgi:hypothetical protein